MQRSSLRASVLVADDHPVFREAVAEIVARHSALELVGQASDGREALARIIELRPDVLVLDLRMPELDGLAVLRAVARDGLATRVLLLSAEIDSATAYDAVEAGAAGFVSKTAPQQEIGDAIAAVARGEVVLAPEIHAGLAEQIRVRSADERPVLSVRELEILKLTATGLSAPEIGRELYVSPATVKTHLQRVYDKLGVGDRAAAVAEGMRRGLIE
jgi:two-component system nitrate/nitrite response regulator NarL